MLRKNIRNWISVLQSVLIFNLILPLIYTMGMERNTFLQQKVYVISFFVVLPVMGAIWSIQHCKSLAAYLGMTILYGSVSVCVGKMAAQNWNIPNKICNGLMLLLGIVTIFAAFDRYLGRMNRLDRKKKLEEKDPNWNPAFNLLERPKWNTFFYFLLVYAVGKNYNSPVLCNEVFLHTIGYLFLLLLSQYIEKTEEYLYTHRNIKNVPSKRIYGISGAMLAVFGCIMVLAISPSIASASKRQYRDFRNFVINIESKEKDPMLAEAEKKQKQKPDPEREAIKKIKIKKTPWWEPLLFNGIGIVMIGAVIVAVIKKILQTFSLFRVSMDENGDEVEALEETKKNTFSVKKKKYRKPKTKEEYIRAEYRKVIRKNRKDIPNPSETPVEIETLANIAETREGKLLHGQYEQARYGKK